MAGSPQNTNMDLEYFKPIEPLGTPGGSAKPVKLGNALAALTALAAAAAALFFFYVVTTARYIGTDTATVEIQLVNREEYQDIYWTLVQGPPPQMPPPGTPARLEEDQTQLYLENLEPNTKYTIVFLEYGSDGEPVIVHTFTFVTNGDGVPQTPEAPPVTPPPAKDPPADEPPQDQEPPQDPPPEDLPPQDQEELPPPYTPPYVPGNGGGGNKPSVQPPKKTGQLEWDERSEKNSITSDYTEIFGNYIPVTITLGSYSPGDYEFRLTEIELTADDTDLTDGDYQNLTYTVGKKDIKITFDLHINPDWVTKGYVELYAQIKGGNYENGKLVGSASETQVLGQVNLTKGYAVPSLDSLLGVGGYGMKVTDIHMTADSKEGSSLTDVVPGQTVFASVRLFGKADRDFTVSLTGSSVVEMTKGTADIAQGDPEAFLWFHFAMPDEDVTETYLGLSLTAASASGGGAMTNPPTFAAPAPAPALPAGPYSVGPLTISQSIHGLQVLSVTFSAAGTEAVQLSDVAPGETVYLNILLQGASLKTFRLGASFASSLPDLRLVQGDDVSIADSDAWLRACFTMPNRPVTAADIGFLGFTAE